MNPTSDRIYLDNAATSWPKPPAVYEAVDHYQRHIGAAAGRSVYREAGEAAQCVAEVRALAAKLINASSARQVVFAFNGTDAINLALHGALRTGDHVVTSDSEHNSVLRPLRYLENQNAIALTIVPCGSEGVLDPADVAGAIRKNTRLIAIIHASNVTGALQPVRDVGRIASEHEVLLMVDAAQSLGHVPVDVQDLNVDLLASPGHKGLLGPMGTGLLYVGPNAESVMRPVRQGGTGTQSDNEMQPGDLPDGFESGNLNAPGLYGLRAGIQFVEQVGLASLRQHERQLTGRLLDGFASIPGVSTLGPSAAMARVGVVSILVDGYDPQEVASTLDSVYRIQTRAGLHCAGRIHAALGTTSRGGAVRFSLGPFNTLEQIDRAVQAVADVAAEKPADF